MAIDRCTLKILLLVMLTTAVVYAEPHGDKGSTTPALPSDVAKAVDDSFKEAFAKQCKDIDASEQAEDLRSEHRNLCQCFEDGLKGTRFPSPGDEKYWRRRLGIVCAKGGDLHQWRAHIRKVLETEDVSRYADKACIDLLRERRELLFYSDLNRRCPAAPIETLDQAHFPQGFINQPNACWRVTGMTTDGCLKTKSCTGDPAHLNYLSITGLTTPKLAKEATLCNANLQKTHKMKDPLKINANHHRPYTQWHLLHPVAPHAGGEYRQPNCHGTAASVAGILGDTEVPGLGKTIAYESTCRPVLQDLYDKAKEKKGGIPTADDLNLSDGIAVNMVYSGCGPNDCGRVEIQSLWCTKERTRAYTFISGMCISCWDRKLQAKGYESLPATSDWLRLGPGCLMTQADHTITIALASNGMCHYYEAPNAGGPPQILVQDCASLFTRFPHRWCPRTPMAFQLSP